MKEGETRRRRRMRTRRQRRRRRDERRRAGRRVRRVLKMPRRRQEGSGWEAVRGAQRTRVARMSSCGERKEVSKPVGIG